MQTEARPRPATPSAREARAKAVHLGASGLALGAAALLAAPAARAFTLLNPALAVDGTDVRVFNNFADPEANDNLTPDAEFPGATGAALAIWKASVEWGSTLHGTGSGDPTQQGDLGSGGSNFEPSWQGGATGPGAIGDNVHSATPTLGGGTIALTEVGSGGWRIRYSETFLWDDDPAGPAGLGLDIQCVATHEYGHALGLGHSTVPGSIMGPTISGGSGHDLGPDDQAGLQFIYGAAAASKPHLAAVLVDASGAVTLVGEGFAAVGNEVWFTQGTPGASGDPVKVLGVTSLGGGTRIDVLLPAAAGPGDVLVKKVGGLASLSNAWPIDAPGGLSCGTLTYGVDLGGANQAELAAASSPELGTTFQMALASFPADGLAFTLIAGSSAALPLFGGTVLVDPSALILVLSTGLTGGAGIQSVAIPGTPGLAGARVFAQAGQPGPGGFTLTNGLEIVLCP